MLLKNGRKEESLRISKICPGWYDSVGCAPKLAGSSPGCGFDLLEVECKKQQPCFSLSPPLFYLSLKKKKRKINFKQF